MSHWEYVTGIWARDHATFVVILSTVLALATTPAVPGAMAQALVWLGAGIAWGCGVVLLRLVTWRRWRSPEPDTVSEFSANVVPLRPRPDAG
jgi:hypothetical protein